ncbi:MAG: hypothetical protein HEQ35_31550 [Gloeotrichia echinulata IR180]|jgi:hypothetical protein
MLGFVPQPNLRSLRFLGLTISGYISTFLEQLKTIEAEPEETQE